MPRNVYNSPPAHLPTPLPELLLHAPEPMQPYDFRSPPFREAQLLLDEDRADSPPPLPIPPRIYAGDGHTRTPTLPRSPTRLETLSQTIRTYAPAALRSSASPPTVSRPLSYGRFLDRYSPYESPPSAVARELGYAGPAPDLSSSEDTITWAIWDVLSHRQVLIIGYATGIQMWDCTDLGSVVEVLNLTVESEQWGFNNFIRARVCGGDLGILLSDSSGQSAFFIYSLRNHQILQRIALPGVASTFESNQHFIVITTTLPPTVHILSSTTFHTLSTIHLDQPPTTSPTLSAQPRHLAVPVIALSHRLLAYASPSPPTSQPPSSTGSAGQSLASSPFGTGNAAIKVGGSVLSGMKFLGGIALEAAKNRISEDGNVRGRFFSTSAPTDERVFANTDNNVVTPQTNPVLESGYYVTVLDLKPLLHQVGKPLKVAEFRTSRSQPISQLAFTRDGCKLISVPENGQVTRVFSLQPRRPTEDSGGDGVRLYDLRRGRTSGIIEGLDTSRDGRWIAIGTRNRTVHVFPTNPSGGPPDLVGHLKGRVRNVDELQPGLVEVAPLVRLRPLKNEQYRAPLAFSFVNPGDVTIPQSILSKYTSSPSPHHRPTQDILVFDPSDGMLSLRQIITDQRPRDHLPLGNLASVSTTAMGVVSRSLPGTGSSPMMTSTSPRSVSRTSSNSASTTGGAEVVMELVGRSEVMATWDLKRKKDWREIRKCLGGGWVNEVVRGPDWLALAELSTCSRSPRILPRSIYLSHQFSFWTFGEDYHALLRQYHFDVRGSKIHVRREVQVSIGNMTSDRFVDDTLDFHHSPVGSASTSFDEPLASALAGDLVTDYHTAYASSVPPILPMYPNGVSVSHQSAAALIRNSIPIRRLGDGATRVGGKIGSYYSPSRNRVLSGGGHEHSISVPLEFDEEDEDFGGARDAVVDTDTVAVDGAGSRTISGMSVGIVLPPTPEERADGEELWKGWESREVGKTVEEMERFDDISVLGFLDEEHQIEREREKEKEKERVAVVLASAGGKKKKKGKGKR